MLSWDEELSLKEGFIYGMRTLNEAIFWLRQSNKGNPHVRKDYWREKYLKKVRHMSEIADEFPELFSPVEPLKE